MRADKPPESNCSNRRILSCARRRSCLEDPFDGRSKHQEFAVSIHVRTAPDGFLSLLAEVYRARRDRRSLAVAPQPLGDRTADPIDLSYRDAKIGLRSVDAQVAAFGIPNFLDRLEQPADGPAEESQRDSEDKQW